MRELNIAATSVPLPAALENIPFGAIKPYLAALIWQMYDENQNQPVFTFKKWFLSFTVTVEMIRPLLVRWFGDHP